ncbi:MAG: helix-turn-helix transcriptional regulator [Chloroflexota bacterium]
MADTSIDLDRDRLGPWLAGLVRSSRTLAGWTQEELAKRAETSQATIWRIETDQSGRLDLAVALRVLTALGIRVSLDANLRHLSDRRRQADAVHAVVNGFSVRRYERLDFETASEVLIGRDAPRGWIDLLAYRRADRSLVVQETKTELPDMGGLQRSLAFYEREAPFAARRLGWDPVQLAVIVVALDTDVVGERLRTNRDVIARAFPSPAVATLDWLIDPARPAPTGWTFALADPATRGARWLRAPLLGAGHRTPPYADYADAARRLVRG